MNDASRPHGHHHGHAHASGATPTRAAIASVATAAFLIVLKGWAAWQTGSVAMLGSLADTGLDLAASLVTLWGIRVAIIPADRDHRFGHGKAEALVALFQSGLIALSAAVIAWRAFGALSGGAAAGDPAAGIAVSLIAMAATGLLLLYQRRVIRASGSIAIHADHRHYQSDFLLNAAVIAALALEGWLGLGGADPLFGIAIAGWLVFGAWRSGTSAIDQLMDREWPETKRRRCLELAAAHPAVDGVHDLRTRTSGAHDFAQFHIWVDPHMTVAAAHQVMDEVEEAIAAEFPRIEMLIHVDPAGQKDAEGVLPSSIAEEASR